MIVAGLVASRRECIDRLNGQINNLLIRSGHEKDRATADLLMAKRDTLMAQSGALLGMHAPLSRLSEAIGKPDFGAQLVAFRTAYKSLMCSVLTNDVSDLRQAMAERTAALEAMESP